MSHIEERIQVCEEALKRTKRLVYDVTFKSKSHHIGSVLSCLHVVTTLYHTVMNIDPERPKEASRDYFFLSKGHAGLAQYAVLADRGFFPAALLEDFGKDGAMFGTHPDKDCLPGVEISSGSLGHGLPIAAGAALLAKKDRLPNHFYTLMSDGECNEGSIWEAVMFAGHHRLNNLVLIIDKNGFQAFGPTAEVLDMSSMSQKFESFGWAVKNADGHSIRDLIDVFDSISFSEESRPTVVIAETIKGKGIASIENSLQSHYAVLDEGLYAEAVAQI